MGAGLMDAWGASWGTAWANSWSPQEAPVTLGEQPRGTAGWLYGPYGKAGRRRTSSDILRARESFGIPAAVSVVIAEVAQRQAEARTLPDAQQRYEELSRELQARGIEWRAEYLEELNARRERLITAEIAARLKLMQQAKDEEMMLLLLAAVA